MLSIKKTLGFSSVLTATRLIAALITNKVCAVYLGPQGYALMGQLQNIQVIATSLGGVCFATGVTKFASDGASHDSEKKSIYSATIRMSLILSAAASIIFLFFSETIAKQYLGSADFTLVIILLSLSIPFQVSVALYVAYLNGKGSIRRYFEINLVQIISVSALVCAFVYFYGIEGALYSMVSSVLLVTLLILPDAKKLYSNSIGLLSIISRKKEYKLIIGQATMYIVASIAVPLSMMTVRGYLINVSGIEVAGLWQALNKISELHVSLVSTTLAVYFLPKISSTVDVMNLRAQIAFGYKFVSALITLSCVALFCMREIIFSIALSPEFSVLSDYYMMQLLGDIFKALSWLGGFILIAKSKFKQYIACEILAAVFFSALPYILDGLAPPLILAVATYVLTYLLYFAATSYFVSLCVKI